MDDAKRIALEVAQGVLAMDESQQYGLLFFYPVLCEGREKLPYA